MSLVAAETECFSDAEEAEVPEKFAAGFVSGLESMLLEDVFGTCLVFPTNAGGGFD